MNDVLYIVMPAYNEEANIRQVVTDWYEQIRNKPEGSSLVVADSGSADRTHEILLEMQKEYPRLKILEDCDKQHGPKCIALYDYAVRNGADYVFQTDSDGQTDPAEFSMFWKHRKEYDAIFGNRPDRKDGISRLFVERIVTLLIRIFFGVRVPDANAPFRLMRCDILSEYLPLFPENYFLPNIMLTVFFKSFDKRVAFHRISFKPRAGGKNSINIPRIVKIGFRALFDFCDFRKKIRDKKDADNTSIR